MNASAAPKTRILIVDDHPIVRHGIATLINSQPTWEVCGEAEDQPTGLALFNETNPDLTIVDISLKSGNGIDLIRQLKAACASARIVVVTGHENHLFAEVALRAGANGYLSKQTVTQNLVAAIDKVLHGHMYVDSSLEGRLVHRLFDTKQLSPREVEVLQQIGQGKTTRQIAAAMNLSPKTIETHRENLKRKLKLSNSAELMHYAVQWLMGNI